MKKCTNESRGFGIGQFWVQIVALPLTSGDILGKLFNISESSSCLLNAYNKN